MIRNILWFISMGISLLFLAPFAIYYKYTTPHNPGDPVNPGVDRAARTWARFMLWVAGVKVDVQGEENILKEPALFVGNHQGNFDIPIILGKLGPLKSIVAKKETEKIPGVHLWMTLFDCIFMDRRNPRQSLECLNRAQELLEQGRSVIIFPEGTRSKGPQMLEFKAGALRCALKAKVPIVPFVTDNSWKVMEAKKYFMKPTNINLHILPAITTADMEKARTRIISEEVQQVMQNELEKIRNTPPQEHVSWMTQED